MAEVLTRRMLEQMLFAIDRPVVVVRSVDGALVCWANEALAQLTGCSREQLLEGCNSWLDDVGELSERLAEGSQPCAFELEGRDSDGERVHWAVQATPIHRAGDDVGAWMLQCAKLVEPVARGLPAPKPATSPRARAQQLQIAREDAVTGILSRAWFEQMLQHALGGARRRDTALALMLFEVEHFDIYVQTFGRKSADACLRLVARAIASAMRRSSDLVARVDHCSFAALAEDMDETNVRAHGARIRNAVEALCIHNPRAPSGRYVTVRYSFQLAVPQAEATAADWLAPPEPVSIAVPPARVPQRSEPVSVARPLTAVTTAITPNAGWSK